MSESKNELPYMTSQEERERMVQLYDGDGMSIRQIMKDTGRAYGTIHRILTIAGVMRKRVIKPKEETTQPLAIAA